MKHGSGRLTGQKGKRSEDEQDRAKKVGPPFHKQISPTKLMGFNTSSFKCTRRTREEHREQKVHLTKNTAGIHKKISPTKPPHEIQRLKASSLSKAKAHGEHERDTGSKKCTSQKKMLEKKSPLQELLRHKPQELEKCIPWQ